MRTVRWTVLFCAVLIATRGSAPAFADVFLSHPPQRPLAVASSRPLDSGPAKFVDATSGRDDADGSQQHPWKTVQRAVRNLAAGETLYLRSGIYFEHIVASLRGSANKPITIRAYPGERVMLDGSLREFQTSPATAWEPVPASAGGAAGEFRSTNTFPDLGAKKDQTNLLGNFVDSMTPLHGYHWVTDMRTDNPYWNVGDKVGNEGAVYCGPGLYFDAETSRIHVRLAHTKLIGLGNNNYRGETDPRKLQLIVAGHAGGSALTLKNCSHVRIQDLEIRGAREATFAIHASANISLDGLTVYGGSAAMQVRDTHGLRMTHSACRGIAAPWTFRGSLKYRAIESRIFSASGWEPTGMDNRDFEIAHCEFTDSVDGIFLGNVRGVRFHHNLVDNVSDDGVYVTSATGYDGTTHGGDLHFFENLFSRCLTTFAFGVGHGRQKTIAGGKQTGDGLHIYRNVFDHRGPVPYYWPSGPDASQELTRQGRLTGDHGSPAWEPLRFYHNTVVTHEPAFRSYYGNGLAGHNSPGVPRRVFNNLFLQVTEVPGPVLTALSPKEKAETKLDFQADGNLHWGFDGETLREDFASRLLKARRASDERWAAHDQYANPKLTSATTNWREPLDARLAAHSPAIDQGQSLPADWTDSRRETSRPDQGAIPAGTEPWRIGVRGRFTHGGQLQEKAVGAPAPGATPTTWAYATDHPLPFRETPATRTLIVQGYPAFDAPLVEYAVRRHRVAPDVREREWVPASEFSSYGLVVIDGSFTRAKITPDRFSAADLESLQKFFDNGGTLLLMRDRQDLFASPEGQRWLTSVMGAGTREPSKQMKITQPDHPWLKHLGGNATPEWLAKSGPALRGVNGEPLIGSGNGASILHRLSIGKGQLIYVGWSPAASIPHGRLPSTVEQEQSFEAQMKIVLQIVASILDRG